MTFFLKQWYNYSVDKIMAWLWRKSDISKINVSSLAFPEHFIPIRYEVMLNKILESSSLTPEEKTNIQLLGRLFEKHYHIEYLRDFLQLKDAFAPFNPDRETIYEPEYTEEEIATKRQILIDGITKLLTKSNYCQLSEDNFNECLKLQPFGGLSVKIDTEKFKHFKIFYRGIREVETTDTFLWIFKRQRKTINFCRIFVLAEYKTNLSEEEIIAAQKQKEKLIHIPEEQAGTIIVKQFRDVLIEHLKIVAPEVKLLLPLFDTIKIISTASAGFFTAIAKLIAFLINAVFNIFLFTGMLVAFFLIFIKGIFGFFNSKTKCMKKFSESLYHKSLSNNIAAVSQLVNQAEAQEVKEALLAFYTLYVHRNENLTMDELDSLVEAELKTAFNYDIDFEVNDALAKLEKNELVTLISGENGKHDRYKSLTLKDALKQLDKIWDNLHSFE